MKKGETRSFDNADLIKGFQTNSWTEFFVDILLLK